MYETQSTRSAAVANADSTRDAASLTDEEISELTELLANTANANANDLLAFSGVRSIAGLMTRIVLAEPSERALLLKAVRRTIAVNRDR